MTVQGQHPVSTKSSFWPGLDLVTSRPSATPDPVVSPPVVEETVLVVVPKSFEVGLCLPSGTSGTSELFLAYNYNIIKIVAAIVQIGYASFQIYQSTGPQIERYGYAAYQLTILPYTIMSLINLLAALCEPEFPAVFLVRRDDGDAISAEVGRVTATEEISLASMRMKEVAAFPLQCL